MSAGKAADAKYDVMVIGGGPNGEVMACYLQRAGAKVLLIERRHEMGGGLLTEDFAGFRMNLHATYMMMGEIMPPFNDLFLPQYGVEFVRPEVQCSLYYEKDKAIVFFLDPEKSATSIQNSGSQDKSKFLNLYSDFRQLCEKALIPNMYSAPRPPAEREALLKGSELGRKVLELSKLSPVGVVEHYQIRDERVKAALLYLGCKWGIDPTMEGMGTPFVVFTYRMMHAALVRGGSHRLNSAVMRSGYEVGLDVRELTEVAKIIIENGTATGVVTSAGEKLHAKTIVSTLNPPQTFLGLIGEEYLDKKMLATAKNWQWDQWSLFCMHMSTKKVPEYKAEASSPHCSEAITSVVGYSSSDQVVKHWKESIDGKLPSTASTVTPTSWIDASQAPRGHNVVRFETETPFQVSGKDWEDIKDEYAKRIIDDWSEYLTNSSSLRIIRNYIYPPNYIEMKLPDMVRGSIKQGAYVPSQMGYLRPNAECSNYSTPIKNLYLSGAATHPGGMITFGPGYNAARKIAEDMKLNIWWPTPDFITEARRNRLIH